MKWLRRLWVWWRAHRIHARMIEAVRAGGVLCLYCDEDTGPDPREHMRQCRELFLRRHARSR